MVQLTLLRKRRPTSYWMLFSVLVGAVVLLQQLVHVSVRLFRRLVLGLGISAAAGSAAAVQIVLDL